MVHTLLTGDKKNIDIVKTLLAAAVIGAMTQFVASFLLTLILNGLFPKTAENYSEAISSIIQFTPLQILSVCIFSPVIEELVFRLALLGTLKRFIPFMAANVIQALLFGIYHGNIVQGVYAFILGFFIGYIYFITDGIIYTVALHICLNTVGMFIDKIIPEGSSMVVNGVISLMAFIVILFLVICIKGKSEVNDNA